MRASKLLVATHKETPREAELASHKLMLRAGLIRGLASGLYNWLPLGVRVLRKIENIIREEMNDSGAQEVLMPLVQPVELWEETGRLDAYGPALLRFKDRHMRDFVLGPTHEEVITDIARAEIKSYRQLPLNLYQIQTKFRDETRPRFGIMRAREFIMKDSYSFHADETSLDETYRLMYQTYEKIFTRIGLEFCAVSADSGEIGGSESHEFHVLADSGEDEIIYAEDGSYAANLEFASAANVKAGDPGPDGASKLKTRRGIEVGHIFKLQDKYSSKLNATITDENGGHIPLVMGCYGIGVSRIAAAAIEQSHDAGGIIWPASIAPFTVVIVPLNYHKSAKVREVAHKLYREMKASNIEVLLDDRKERAGAMFADWELVGIPHRIVIGERRLAQGELEYRGRTDKESVYIPFDAVHSFVHNRL